MTLYCARCLQPCETRPEIRSQWGNPFGVYFVDVSACHEDRLLERWELPEDRLQEDDEVYADDVPHGGAI